jgi:hypothetical protein
MSDMSDTMTPLPVDDPRMIAWKAYRESAEYANAAGWAVFPENTEGSLWAAFIAGFEAARVEPVEPAMCASCQHLHTTIEQGGSWSVLHRCRVKGCDCREFIAPTRKDTNG